MRVAVLSDIHGNDLALDAVLADARLMGVEQYWVIGDFSAIGPEPAAVLERLARLDNAIFTRGNTDRYTVTGEHPPPTLADVRNEPALIPAFAAIAASFAWTRGYLTAGGWLEWLDRLPLEFRFRTPSGQRILAVHASPGTDDGAGVHPGRSNSELQALLAGTDEDIVFIAHTHEAMLRRIGHTTLVNPGSVGNPRAPDLRASYVVLEMKEQGIELELRRAAWDHTAFAESVRRSRHPAAEFILGHVRGEQPGRSPHPDNTPFATGQTVRIPYEAGSAPRQNDSRM